MVLRKLVIMDFAYEYTYQDCEYIIRTMSTKHAQCACLALLNEYFQLVTKP